MIEGLKLTLSGEELRKLLEAGISRHRECADWWAHEKTRTSEDEVWDAVPEHMCTNESERHVWRADVLQFIRDHLEPAETYRLCAADLEFGELLPSRPGWLVQDEYEERNRAGFALERMTKAVDRLAGATQASLWRDHSEESVDVPLSAANTDEFRGTRLDTGDGPEVIMIERND